MKKNNIRVLGLAVAMAVSCVFMGSPAKSDADGSQSFTDVPPSHWAYTYIEEMVEKGYLNGNGDGTFNPSGYVTQAEFRTMLAKAFYGPWVEEQLEKYTGSYWWYPYVNGTANAYAVTLMRPEITVDEEYWIDVMNVLENLTRADVASILSELLSVTGLSPFPGDYNNLKTTNYVSPLVTITESFDDLVYLDEAAIVYYGFMSGVTETTFNREGLFTRAEAATVLHRIVNSQVIPEHPLYGEQEVFDIPAGQYNVEQHYIPADANKDGVITEEEVYARMMEFQKFYPNGTKWDTSMGGCNAYADRVMQWVFGDWTRMGNISYIQDAPTGQARLVTDVNDIRPGDIIYQIDRHVEVCLSINNELTHSQGTELVVMATDGNVGSQVNWDGFPGGGDYAVSMDRLQAEINDGRTIVVTLYPE